MLEKSENSKGKKENYPESETDRERAPCPR